MGAAYELFSRQGIGAVGVDAVVERAGVAKVSLYRHFRSKEGLVLAFLRQREEIWTQRWLETEVRARADDPEGRLLAVFELFDDWFQKSDFEGCSFINVLLEAEPGGPVRAAAAGHLANIRAILEGLAEAAGLDDVAGFARTWHILMKGSIVAAGEGSLTAALEARRAGEMILKAWPRRRQ